LLLYSIILFVKTKIQLLVKMADQISIANSRLTKVSDILTGNKVATSIPWDPDCTTFPSRKDVPRREGAPEGA
jgi:hypothetical protein